MVTVAGVLLLVLAVPSLLSRSFWLDEAWVADAVLRRSFDSASLSTTPIGFAVLVWAVSRLAPGSEAAYRVVPLLFGLATLPVSYLLAKRHFRCRLEPSLAVLLLGTNLVFVTYCRTLKPYTLDAFCGVSLLLLAHRVEKVPCRAWWMAYGIALASSVAVSFGAIFFVPVTAGLLFLSAVRSNHRPAQLRRWVAAHVGAGLTFGLE